MTEREGRIGRAAAGEINWEQSLCLDPEDSHLFRAKFTAGGLAAVAATAKYREARGE